MVKSSTLPVHETLHKIIFFVVRKSVWDYHGNMVCAHWITGKFRFRDWAFLLIWTGGRGSRGRFGYHTEGTRGRFSGRSFGRGSDQDSFDRDYNRPRGNGLYRQVPRQERAYSSNHQGTRNGYNLSEWSLLFTSEAAGRQTLFKQVFFGI